MAALVKCKSWKAMMHAGRDSREGSCLSLGLIVSWLLAGGCVVKTMSLSTASREFGVVRGCTIVCVLGSIPLFENFPVKSIRM